MDSVYPPPNRYGPPKNAQKNPPAKPSEQPAPNVHARPPPPANATKQDGRVNNNQRPQGLMKPVNYPPKPAAEEKKGHYCAPIESHVEMKSLANRTLEAPITLTARELLATSLDVRHHLKDLIASKQVVVNMVDEPDYDIARCFETQPESPKPINFSWYKCPTTAHASLPLRVIYPSFALGVELESILDSGAQVVMMRHDIWEKLNYPLVANKAMRMESANSSHYQMMGMIENVPVTLRSVTVHLQIQVVNEAPFEVLLGQPFFDILSCGEQSKPGGHHSIEICDPHTRTPYFSRPSPGSQPIATTHLQLLRL